MEFTGRVPLEMHSIKLLSDGLLVQFTKPLAAEVELTATYVRIEQFGYHYWGEYGSPKIDREILRVSSIYTNADRREVRLQIKGLKPDRVCHLTFDHLPSADGDFLLHPQAFYTINHLAD